MGFKRHKAKSGSAFLLVLVVMVGSLGLIAGLQQVLIQRTTELRIQQNEIHLRNALLMGLQTGVELLSNDDDLTVDSLQDSWTEPREYTTSDGVRLLIILEDAQNRFNVNHLSLPVPPTMPRTYLDMFESLMHSPDNPVEPFEFQRLQAIILNEEIWFHNLQALGALPSVITSQWINSPLLIALPRPGNRPLPVNINTVKPEVLTAMVGPSLKAWTDSVLSSRESQPIRNVGSALRSLPAILQPMLLNALDIRTEYVIATLVAEVDYTQKKGTALLHRLPGGEVEILRCQW